MDGGEAGPGLARVDGRSGGRYKGFIIQYYLCVCSNFPL